MQFIEKIAYLVRLSETKYIRLIYANYRIKYYYENN